MATNNKYRAKIKHDNGELFLVVYALTEEAAISAIMESENCPRNAIEQIHDTQFYNKDGSLTKYAFSCGYIETKSNSDRWKTIDFEHNTFHVKSGKKGSIYDIWETFGPDELTKARKLFKTL